MNSFRTWVVPVHNHFLIFDVPNVFISGFLFRLIGLVKPEPTDKGIPEVVLDYPEVSAQMVIFRTDFSVFSRTVKRFRAVLVLVVEGFINLRRIDRIMVISVLVGSEGGSLDVVTVIDLKGIL